MANPVIFVIFGATGNLAKKRIFPALFALWKQNLLPPKFKIAAAARTPFTNQVFRKILPQHLEIENKERWDEFAANIDYLPLDVARDFNLKDLSLFLDDFEKSLGSCAQRIFYMAVAPDIFEKAVDTLGKNNLHQNCAHGKKPRIIIEKPFGRDLKSAQSLNVSLIKYFAQNQIYRIDHYLGKETVQNIFAFRFANEIFEPIWSNQYIESVQVTTAEAIGVETRGEFYDKTGAMRDILQNHLIQLMALVAMDAPEKFEAASINAKKLGIIKSIRKLSASEIKTGTVRAQYEGYLLEEKISPDSQTETYALTKLFIDTPRWQGVPFYLRTGKKLEGKVTSIIIQFKEKDHKLFEGQKTFPNHITIQIQPNEGIGVQLAAKKPGLSMELEPVDMEFCYKTSFDTPQPEAYERLLLDVMLGDQSLFMSEEAIEEAWKIIDPIEEAWNKNLVPLTTYKPGTWGPKTADDLIKKDGRRWLAPILTICKI
ncbi:glucose-6-phosphate dehydrogenase [Candidatus Curtissbacteria bacterium]|nr:glucose-6-phosphate dehydrogenase [Candidatus Curtissbacteria bacterium]